MAAIHIDSYSLVVERCCQDCGQSYTIAEYAEESQQSFHKPERYIDGCEQFCLACWLGVGPTETAETTFDANDDSALAESSLCVEAPHREFRRRHFEVAWPYNEVYDLLLQGNLIDAYEWFFNAGWHLAVLPITRVKVLHPVFFPNGGAIYPAQTVQCAALNAQLNRPGSANAAERCSAAAGIQLTTIEQNSVVVLPCQFDWDTFLGADHADHLGLIRALSSHIESTFLDFLRYRNCRIDCAEILPGRPGQTRENARMSGALLYNHSVAESKIVGGAAFSHTISTGMGMPVTQPEWDQMPLEGEAGRVGDHALLLYSSLLEARSQTAAFMQAVALLEFLACPWEYQQLKKVRAIVVRCAAHSPVEREQLTEWFKTRLFGSKGYREAIVHGGKRLEQLVPGERDRSLLLKKLDRCIRAMIDHLIRHSQLDWLEYANLRLNK